MNLNGCVARAYEKSIIRFQPEEVLSQFSSKYFKQLSRQKPRNIRANDRVDIYKDSEKHNASTITIFVYYPKLPPITAISFMVSKIMMML